VLAVPVAADAPRIEALAQRIAAAARGVVSPRLHVTLAYYFNVTETQLAGLRAGLGAVIDGVPPLHFRAAGLVTAPGFAERHPDAVIFDVEKTPAMAALYTALCALGQRRGLTCLRQDAAEWQPHMKVLDSHMPAGDARRQIEAMAADLHFTAAELVLSYRPDAESPWVEVAGFPLTP
jgi:2'-5' RNA ligase